MSIKHIINSEIKDLNLDLIIEGLDEIISNGNFTTVLSETDKVQGLKEDGDVVVNIVNDELNKDNCTLEENVNNLNDNFWRWFGNSKVVKNGKPLIMHHGGSFSPSKPKGAGISQPFNEFRGTAWFTAYKAGAKYYAKQGGDNLTSVYLKIENPLYSGKQEDGSYIETNRAVDIAQKSNKYDGVIDIENGKIFDAIVWNSKQIKSIENNGEYNPSEVNVMKEDSEILSEGLSDILYHFTYTTNLINILKYNKFATSSNLGSNADSWKDKGRFYFFSTQRTKGMSGYARHHGNVAIVLDGRKLNQTFKGSPTDYWNWSKKRSDYKSIGDYTNALQSEENEDRIVTNKPYIDNANSYILEVHISISEQSGKDEIEEIQTLCQSLNIPVYFYTDENAFKLQDKRKAIDINSLNLQPKDKTGFYSDEKEGERDLYNAKWFFKKIAPSIIAGNDINDGYNDERDQIEKLLKQLLEKGGQPDQYDNVMQDINDKVKRMGTNYGYGYIYGDDEYRSMQAEIHNHRGDPNPYLRELLKMLIADMKKWRVKNLKEYFNKKFKTGIK
jgi:hypothetical protein